MSSPDNSRVAGQARYQWSRIIDAASSAQEHAAVMEVRRQFGRDDPPPHAAMVDAYRRVIDSKRYAGLDAVALDAVALTDLAAIVEAGPAGLPSRRFPYTARLTLHRAQLVTHTTGDGLVVGADEARSTTVRATLAGIAVVRAARTRVFPLSETDAAAFAKLDADNGLKAWPGTGQGERIARYWALVEHTDGWYRLTPAGRAALNQHRTPTDQIMPSFHQGGVLTHAARLRGRVVDLEQFDSSVVQQCVTRQWIVRSGLVAGARRAAYRITDSGLDALDRFREAERKRLGTPERLIAVQLKAGMWIRLVNRRELPVTDAYVQVVDVQVIKGAMAEVGNANPGYQVLVVDEPGGTPYVYGGRQFYPATKYEIRPSETAAA